MSPHPFAIAVVAFAACSAQARETYRCELGGGRGLTTSPTDCPGGRAKLVERRAEPTSPVGSPSRVHTTPARPLEPALPNAQSRPPPATIDCERKHGSDLPALRNCLRELRRAELRATLGPRLVAMSRAVSEIAGLPRAHNGLLATGVRGRPSAWCEDLLNDVMLLKNLEIVDDESTVGPRPFEVVDPGFEVWNVGGSLVTNGYVTVRWRGSEPLVLSTATACSTAREGSAVVCNPIRYTALNVHEVAMPLACSVSFIDFKYWPNWRHSSSVIQLGRHSQVGR